MPPIAAPEAPELDAFGLPPIDPARATWLAARRKVVGGSEVAALFGCQPAYALSLYALWHVKAGRIPEPEVTGDRPAWGLKLEAAIAAAAAEQEGWTIEPRGHVVHPKIAGMGATLDYIITAGERGRDTVGALEIKNADWLQHRRAWTDDEPPLNVLLQLQHQLAVTGYTWGAVACLIGGNSLQIYRYDARPPVIADIEKRVAAFWQSIAAGKVPVTDGSDSTAVALRALYPELEIEEADLTADNELPTVCAKLLHATERRKAAAAEEDEAKNAIFAKLGEHMRGLTEGFGMSIAVTPGKPDRIITAADVGKTIKGRKESRRLTVKEFAQ